MPRQPGSDSLFEQAVANAFQFLRELGFEPVERNPTLVRYRGLHAEVEIYQGRRSFEIGAGVSIDGERFSVSELVRLTDPRRADVYRNPVAMDDEGVLLGVWQVASLLQEYGALALRGDRDTLETLRVKRQEWSDSLALDALVEQTRPLAERAFKAGEYAKAAQLYLRIHSRLSASEKRRLEIAAARSETRH